MSRPNPAFLAVFLAYVVISTVAAALLKGGLYLNQHEGDTLHLFDILTRLDDGARIHQDFMTPIGILAFWPIHVFTQIGFGYGMALHMAQALVATLLLPAIWWVSYSRMSRLWAYTYGALTLVMITALSYGTGELSTSMSMHYNRWGWALCFIALPLAVLPSRSSQAKRLEGVLIGLALAAMALLKATYFVSFLPAVVIILLVRKALTTLSFAALAGGAVALGTVLIGGFGYIEAYVGDLVAVSQSSLRVSPGQPLGALMVAPNYLGGMLIAIAAVILLRQARASEAGLAVLLLLPGFVYVTYQNFGNDRIWLFLLAVMLLMLRPEPGLRNARNWDLRLAITLNAVAALAIIFPSAINLTTSTLRHLGTPTADKVLLIPTSDIADDVFVPRTRGEDMLTATQGTLGAPQLDALNPDFGSFAPQPFGDETFAPCTILSGMSIWYTKMAADMRAAGLIDGRTIFTADTLSALPLYADIPHLPKGAPWYYGQLTGFENAEVLVVPRCPLDPKVRDSILKDLSGRAMQMPKLFEGDYFVAYQIRP